MKERLLKQGKKKSIEMESKAREEKRDLISLTSAWEKGVLPPLTFRERCHMHTSVLVLVVLVLVHVLVSVLVCGPVRMGKNYYHDPLRSAAKRERGCSEWSF